MWHSPCHYQNFFDNKFQFYTTIVGTIALLFKTSKEISKNQRRENISRCQKKFLVTNLHPLLDEIVDPFSPIRCAETFGLHICLK